MKVISTGLGLHEDQHVFALVAWNESPASESRKTRPCTTKNKIPLFSSCQAQVPLCSFIWWGPGFSHSPWSKFQKQWYVDMRKGWWPKIWDYTIGADLGICLPPPRPMAAICPHIHSIWQLRSKWAFPPGWLWGSKISKHLSHQASSLAKTKRSL